MKRPNILLLVADDLGYGDLSCYPHEDHVKTPSIDRLAASGVKFLQAYADPICSPTRASLLTGMFPQHVGVYGNPDGYTPGIGPFRDTFPKRLQAEGYRTSWLGKWHQGWDVCNHPLNNGFDNAYGFLGGMHDYYDPCVGDHYYGGPYAKHAFVFDGIRPQTDMTYLTNELTERAIQEIKKPSQNPFFIYLAYNTPHTPYQAPDEKIKRNLDLGMEPVDAVRRAMIDVLDDCVAELINALKETGELENTLVVFASDNGPEFEKDSGGLRGKKGSLYEGGIRVPVIASWPGVIPPNTECQSITRINDLCPTFLGIAGVDLDPEEYDGKDLLPYLKGDSNGNVHDMLIWAAWWNRGGCCNG